MPPKAKSAEKPKWLDFVKAYKAKNKDMPLKECLKNCSELYKKL